MRLFCDTEFTDFVNPVLISLALVSEDGKHKFYGELLQYEWLGNQSSFVTEVVLPQLTPDTAYHRPELAQRLNQWLETLVTEELLIVVDYPTDYHLLVDLLEELGPLADGKLQAAMTNAVIEAEAAVHGAKYGYSNVEVDFRTKSGIDRYHQAFTEYFSNARRQQHHALHDAEAMREGFTAALTEVQRGIYHRLLR